MIPQLFVELKQMPLTPNGKIDRKALPEPFQSIQQTHESTPPATQTEKQIAELWQKLLMLDEIDIDQNFFDVGGHSLLALDLIFQLEKQHGVRVSPLDILLNSLAQIAAQIDQAKPPQENKSAPEHGQEAPRGNIIKRLFSKNKRT